MVTRITAVLRELRAETDDIPVAYPEVSPLGSHHGPGVVQLLGYLALAVASENDVTALVAPVRARHLQAVGEYRVGELVGFQLTVDEQKTFDGCR
jgi:hypothetical protein